MDEECRVSYTYNDWSQRATVNRVGGSKADFKYDEGYMLGLVSLTNMGATGISRNFIRILSALHRNKVRFAYGGYDNVGHAKDKHSEAAFANTILGSLESRKQNWNRFNSDMIGKRNWNRFYMKGTRYIGWG